MQLKWKLGLLACLSALLICVFPQEGQAAAPANLYMDGNSITLSEPITMINNSVMLPIRVVSEKLGYKVVWEGKKQTVTISNSSKTIKLVVDEETALVDKQQVKLPVPSKMIKDTTLVPMRFVGEALGLVVEWDKASQSVYLYTPDDGASITPSTPSSEPTGNNGGVTGGEVVPPTSPVGPTTPNPNPDSSNPVQPPSGGSPVDPTPPIDTTQPGGAVDGSGGISNGGSTVVVDPNEVPTLPIQEFAFFDNMLYIVLDKQVEPQMIMMTNPDRLVIDLPNAVFSEQFKSKFVFNETGQGEIAVPEQSGIQRIRYGTFSTSPQVARFVIDGNGPLTYSLDRSTEGVLAFEITPASSTTPPSTHPIKDQYTVVIDAGHGGSDPGTTGVKKRVEKDFTLALSLKVAELAKSEPKLRIVMTRETDVYPTRPERVKLANDLNADLFVSIHGNSIEDKPSVSGTETFYYRPDSKAFAETMHHYLMQGTMFKDRGAKKENHEVTRNTKMSAILLEIGFMSNQVEADTMHTEEFQWRVAQQIVNGLKAQLGLMPLF